MRPCEDRRIWEALNQVPNEPEGVKSSMQSMTGQRVFIRFWIREFGGPPDGDYRFVTEAEMVADMVRLYGKDWIEGDESSVYVRRDKNGLIDAVMTGGEDDAVVYRVWRNDAPKLST